MAASYQPSCSKEEQKNFLKAEIQILLLLRQYVETKEQLSQVQVHPGNKLLTRLNTLKAQLSTYFQFLEIQVDLGVMLNDICNTSREMGENSQELVDAQLIRYRAITNPSPELRRIIDEMASLNDQLQQQLSLNELPNAAGPK
jgi:hypothetical protein